MFDRVKAVFCRYPDNKAGATMAVLEFLAAQGVRLGPFTQATQSEGYFSKGSRRACEVYFPQPGISTTARLTGTEVNRIKGLLKNGKKSPLRTTDWGELVWKGWLEFRFKKAGKATRARRNCVCVEYEPKIARKPQQPDTVTFGLVGTVTCIHQTYHHGMLAVILCVTCGLGLLYYSVQLSLPYPPPKSNLQKFLEGCKALFGY
ncbi:hypothetical protein ASPACDRAFT_56969 [Aspergillus aculeatus ATCC 16872]|uniref:Uncharacterized protein n=1 Tax=Aspergillus aculeatus (strain ATCC 16872 / CBS 172.66 / WB 5094) TaxID=690307 RepID=A0A1L9X5L6_ASPA1|nr:uncharacterized protein ASPACDRAFT_56969 [Aspergillus aculeatus ATCC 16872]OJK03578.1 hypothetical protein ASPACDRAFT_56969 [Aspergillus aculeatus ATCC 16872]